MAVLLRVVHRTAFQLAQTARFKTTFRNGGVG
jgi:hypothetical protein